MSYKTIPEKFGEKLYLKTYELYWLTIECRELITSIRWTVYNLYDGRWKVGSKEERYGKTSMTKKIRATRKLWQKINGVVADINALAKSEPDILLHLAVDWMIRNAKHEQGKLEPEIDQMIYTARNVGYNI